MTLNLLKPEFHIYQKIIAVFLALLIPLFAFNLWINKVGSSYLENEISKSVYSNIEFFSRQLDDEFARIKIQQLNLLSDSDLQRLSYFSSMMDEYEKTQTINRLLERLGILMNSSTYIKNAGVYINSLNITISVKDGVCAVPNDEYNYLTNLNNVSSSILIKGNKILLIESNPQERELVVNRKSCVVYIEISKEKIVDVLSDMAKYKNSGFVLTNGDSGFTITSEKNSHLLVDIISKTQNVKNGDLNSFRIKTDRGIYWVEYSKMNFMNLLLLNYLPENSVTGDLKKYNTMFFAFIMISVAIVIIFSLLINIMIHKPLGNLVSAFKSLINGGLDTFIQCERNDEFGYLYQSFNTMVEKMKIFIKQNYEQKMALQHSEFKQLQSQINPHFLFNCFCNISRMCKCEDYDNAMKFTQKLGSYYQYITRNGVDEIPFSLEYKHAMNYIEIQNIRFMKRINVNTTEIPEQCMNLLVPRIILQPIIENVYEHGFELSTIGGHIYISTTFNDGVLHIIIEDDGQNLSNEILDKLKSNLANVSTISEKTGIINVNRRLQLKYGEGNGLKVSRSNYGGLKAEIVINFNNM